MLKNLLIGLAFVTLLTGCASKRAYNHLVSTAWNSIPEHEAYIKKYPDGKYTPDAKQRLERLNEDYDWTGVISKKKSEDFKEFLRKHPDGKHKDDAEKKFAYWKEEEDWAQAKLTNTVAVYEDFIKNFPSGKYLAEAQKKLHSAEEERDWQLTLNNETSQALKDFLNKYPGGTYEVRARNELYDVDSVLPTWEQTKKANNEKSYIAFSKKYPSSKYNQLCKKELEVYDEKEWQKDSKLNTIYAYNNYLKKFPDGKYAKEAEKRAVDMEVADIMKGRYGQLPPMSKSGDGVSLSDVSVINISNDTEYTLTIRYSGKSSKKIVLAPKTKGSLTLDNGTYTVAASASAANVTNYVSVETLSGFSYSTSFYIEHTIKWGY